MVRTIWRGIPGIVRGDVPLLPPSSIEHRSSNCSVTGSMECGSSKGSPDHMSSPSPTHLLTLAPTHPPTLPCPLPYVRPSEHLRVARSASRRRAVRRRSRTLARSTRRKGNRSLRGRRRRRSHCQSRNAPRPPKALPRRRRRAGARAGARAQRQCDRGAHICTGSVLRALAHNTQADCGPCTVRVVRGAFGDSKRYS